MGLALAQDPRTRLALGLAVLAWMVVFVGAGLGASGAGQSGPSTLMSSGHTHTVAAGETLWSIASHVGRGGDTREVVDEIVSLNHLAGTAISAGQVLVLP